MYNCEVSKSETEDVNYHSEPNQENSDSNSIVDVNDCLSYSELNESYSQLSLIESSHTSSVMLHDFIYYLIA